MSDKIIDLSHYQKHRLKPERIKIMGETSATRPCVCGHNQFEIIPSNLLRCSTCMELIGIVKGDQLHFDWLEE